MVALITVLEWKGILTKGKVSNFINEIRVGLIRNDDVASDVVGIYCDNRFAYCSLVVCAGGRNNK